ncbi:zinc transporter 1 [Lates japonicus]|uniref:Zinc transporter 1 n=1 Tax=Lates japonicus TaxID=270547 RepID=A0AAD3RIF8_LATJO|nr:zinc transporter 1 [Lates japonicus]
MGSRDPVLVAAVNAAGALVNLLGLCLFHGHAGGATDLPEATSTLTGIRTSPGCKDNTEVQMNGNTHYEEMDHDTDSSSQLNMRGVFLHVLGDALGSVIVVVNAIIFTFVWQPCKGNENCTNPCINSHTTDHRHVNHTLVDLHENATMPIMTAGPCWVLYLDPTLCIIMVCILLYTTYPLLLKVGLILLNRAQSSQHAPAQRRS